MLHFAERVTPKITPVSCPAAIWPFSAGNDYPATAARVAVESLSAMDPPQDPSSRAMTTRIRRMMEDRGRTPKRFSRPMRRRTRARARTRARLPLRAIHRCRRMRRDLLSKDDIEESSLPPRHVRRGKVYRTISPGNSAGEKKGSAWAFRPLEAEHQGARARAMRAQTFLERKDAGKHTGNGLNSKLHMSVKT